MDGLILRFVIINSDADESAQAAKLLERTTRKLAVKIIRA